MGHWSKEASAFVRDHRKVLAERPLWLFSSGPVGTEHVDEQGRDALEASRPKEFEEFQALVHPRDERVFFGAWDPQAPPVGSPATSATGRPSMRGLPRSLPSSAPPAPPASRRANPPARLVRPEQ
jgi:hypothetical protein